MPVATQLEILDLRHFSARQLRPLLESEAEVWQQRLRWNYRGSTELLLQYLDSRILPGFVALDRGRICGFTFCVYEGNKAVVGDAYAVAANQQQALQITHTLLQHLLDLLLHSPGIHRIESHEAAKAPGAEAAGYLKVDWDHGQPIEAVNGEKDLFGDSSVVLVPLPGHTPGIIGAVVSLDRDGQFLLASDSVSLRQHLDTDAAPRNTWNVEQQLKTYAEVRRIEKRGATVICGHDDKQWQSLRKGSEGYE